MTDLAYISATEAARLFRTRSLSPVELMQAVIARAEATEPTINALTYTYFDAALDQARLAEDRFASDPETARPLEGLAVAIKDAGHVAGYPTSAGSLTSDEAPQPASSPINARVLEAGAIMHARSATPEFSCATFTHSKRWGVTRNPWNLDATPGGSSGGAGAALAAGSATLATGSDIGGSIRIPAACCGVVGYKPPHGRNPVDAPFNLDFYCHTGPMARSVADTILLQNSMCGPHPADSTTLRPKLTLPDSYAPISGWRIAYSYDLGAFETSEEVRRTTRDALDVFRDLGAEVVEIDLPWDAGIVDAAQTHLEHIFGTSIAPLLRDHSADLTDYARAFAKAGPASQAEEFFDSLTRAGAMAAEFGAAIDGFDLFLCPTTACPAVPADFNHATDELRINGRAINPMLGWVMTTPFNMMSRHPVLTLPSGRAQDGVPTGIQLVGQTFRDVDVFQAGMAYETALGGWYTTPRTRPAL